MYCRFDLAFQDFACRREPLTAFLCTNLLGRMATSQFRKTGAASAPATHRTETEGLRNQLEYSQEVLRRYRQYVEEKLEVDLANTRRDRDRLGQRNEELHDENEALKNAVIRLRQEAQDSHRIGATAKKEATDELRRIVNQHDDHLASVKAAAELEKAKLSSDLQRAVEQLKSLSSLAAAARDLDKLRGENETLQSELTRVTALYKHTQTSLAELQTKGLDLSQAAGALLKATTEVSALVEESHDASQLLRTAFAHAGVTLYERESPWKACVENAERIQANQGKLADDIREPLTRLTALVGAIRKTSAQDRSLLAAAVKSLVVQHSDTLQSYTQKDHEHQRERDLYRRRLQEMENDRKSEREALMQANEKDRVRSLLVNPSNSGAGAGLSVLDNSLGSPARGRSAGGATADAHHFNNNPNRIAVPTRTSACQTGPELLGTVKEQQHATRLMQEIHTLQTELTQHKETIQLMERQRSLFMTFVEDEQTEAEVRKALGYGAIDSEQFVLYGANAMRR